MKNLLIKTFLLGLVISISYGETVVISQDKENLAEVYINSEPIGILSNHGFFNIPKDIVNLVGENISIVSRNKNKDFIGMVSFKNKFIQLKKGDLKNGVWYAKNGCWEKLAGSSIKTPFGVGDDSLKLISKEIIKSVIKKDIDSKYKEIVEYIHKNYSLKQRKESVWTSKLDKGNLIIRTGRAFALVYCLTKDGSFLPMLRLGDKDASITVDCFVFRYDKNNLYFYMKDMADILIKKEVGDPSYDKKSKLDESSDGI